MIGDSGMESFKSYYFIDFLDESFLPPVLPIIQYLYEFGVEEEKIPHHPSSNQKTIPMPIVRHRPPASPR